MAPKSQGSAVWAFRSRGKKKNREKWGKNQEKRKKSRKNGPTIPGFGVFVLSGPGERKLRKMGKKMGKMEKNSGKMKKSSGEKAPKSQCSGVWVFRSWGKKMGKMEKNLGKWKKKSGKMAPKPRGSAVCSFRDLEGINQGKTGI